MAYSLHRSNTTNRAKEKTIEILNSFVPKGSIILLSFGEIDCRNHIVKQSLSKNKKVDNIIKDCVSKYFEGIHSILKSNYKVIIYNTIPSRINNQKPITISKVIRENNIKRKFNKSLSKRISEYGYNFLSIYDDITNKKNIGVEKYYMKGESSTPHLSQKVMPFLQREVRKIEVSNGW